MLCFKAQKVKVAMRKTPLLIKEGLGVVATLLDQKSSPELGEDLGGVITLLLKAYFR